MALILIGGSRFAFRILAEQSAIAQPNEKNKRALIIGAGDAGALVVRELQKSSQLNLTPVGFLDDDEQKLGRLVSGRKVFGRVSEFSKFMSDLDIKTAIVAIPSLPPERLSALTASVQNSTANTMILI